jgi:hypothetical protein
MLKTLRDAQCRNEIEQRLGNVRPECQRRWGKMTSHQMVCHLADSFRGVVGEKALAPRPGVFARSAMRWIALYPPIKWPHGVQTMPEMDQEIGGTRPLEFASDVQELRRLLQKFTREPREFAWTPHPIFGVLVDEGVDALGVPPHGPSFPPVRRVN